MTDNEKENKIYCANCIHCKLVRVSTDDNHYQLRVRCGAGKWRKKLGEEKMYKYFTVVRRTIDDCSDYESMGDDNIYLKDLKRDLPLVDETYLAVN